jgi:DNA-binding transcriptional regulator YiaG
MILSREVTNNPYFFGTDVNSNRHCPKLRACRNNMKTKIAKEFKYSDLGIDIILRDVVLYKLGHEWIPKIDIEKLSKRVFSLLTYRAASFSGNEILFIRTYLQMSKSEFGRELKVSHTAVAKWEKSGKKISSMDLGTELLLKMVMAEKSGAKASRYQEIYKKTKEHDSNSKQEQFVIFADAA